MKKLLVIGAGIGQINIVKLAKEMGLYVIVVSPKGYPAIELSDELFECDIYDYDKIVDFAKVNHVDAVISDQNDLMVPTVAYVAEKLGLPGLTYEQALSYCDKNKFRNICREVGVPVPESISVSNTILPTSFNVSLPWIVKPSDSQSSIGISKIENLNEYYSKVENALNKSKHHIAIVEQFFTGDEFVCEGFVYKGKYFNLFFGDRRYFSDTLIPSQTLFPSELEKEIQEKILVCEQKLSSHINTSFGITHSEYLVNRTTGEFIIVESAIRGGGVYISSHLVPLATGIDVNKLLIQCALGQVVDIETLFKNKTNNSTAYICFTLPEGTITNIEGLDKLCTIPGVVMYDIRDMCVGEYTHKMVAKGMRKGPIIIYGSCRLELEKIIEQLKETIRVVVYPDIENSVIWN